MLIGKYTISPANIILSGLLHVSLCGHDGPDTRCDADSLPALSDLLDRSHCSLRCLHLYNVMLAFDNGLVELLQRTPTLTELQIGLKRLRQDEDQDSGQLIKCLEYDLYSVEADAVLLPKLEVLEISLEDDVRRSDKPRRDPVKVTAVNGIRALVESRLRRHRSATAPYVVPLRTVSFYADNAVFPGLRDADIEVLMRCKADGLNVKVVTRRTTFHADDSSPELDFVAFSKADGRHLVSKTEGKSSSSFI